MWLPLGIHTAPAPLRTTRPRFPDLAAFMWPPQTMYCRQPFCLLCSQHSLFSSTNLRDWPPCARRSRSVYRSSHSPYLPPAAARVSGPQSRGIGPSTIRSAVASSSFGCCVSFELCIAERRCFCNLLTFCYVSPFLSPSFRYLRGAQASYWFGTSAMVGLAPSCSSSARLHNFLFSTIVVPWGCRSSLRLLHVVILQRMCTPTGICF